MTESKPLIVLVHGAWADGSSWTKSTHAAAGGRPRCGDRAEHASRRRGRRRGRSLVPRHRRWAGGARRSLVRRLRHHQRRDRRANVKALVYVDAFIPDDGQPAGALGPESALTPAFTNPGSVFKVVPIPGAPPNVVDTYCCRTSSRRASRMTCRPRRRRSSTRHSARPRSPGSPSRRVRPPGRTSRRGRSSGRGIGSSRRTRCARWRRTRARKCARWTPRMCRWCRTRSWSRSSRRRSRRWGCCSQRDVGARSPGPRVGDDTTRAGSRLRGHEELSPSRPGAVGGRPRRRLFSGRAAVRDGIGGRHRHDIAGRGRAVSRAPHLGRPRRP